jgi:predicted porin
MKTQLTLLAFLSGVSLCARAEAESPKAEIYGYLLPFLEYARTTGATAPGFTGGASQVPAAAYTGVNDPARFRMTAGTSAIGFRGSWEFAEGMKLVWQLESAVPIDGNGPPNTWASRNSHLGFSTPWGTLIYGIWDTPYKWSNLIIINPIYGGYVPDSTAILSTPGFGVGALNTAQGFAAGSASNAAFYRREANSIQYWSPNLGGFSVRAAFVANEGRSLGGTSGTTTLPPTNPYIVSGYLGYDGNGFRIRVAGELHNDFFGMSQLGGSPVGATAAMGMMGPATPTVTSSTDIGYQGLIQYTLAAAPDLKTRIMVDGEMLRYKNDDTTSPMAINVYSRPAFYALLEQSFSQHHLWVTYGQAFEGSCERVGGGPCSTTGLGAKHAAVGYLFALTDTTNIHLVGYKIFNDNSARYVTFPPLSANAPGAGTMGVGLGFIYVFTHPVLSPAAPGPTAGPPPAAPPAAPPVAAPPTAPVVPPPPGPSPVPPPPQ